LTLPLVASIAVNVPVASGQATPAAPPTPVQLTPGLTNGVRLARKPTQLTEEQM